eukprot:1160676-Pelagomonas_calceolata.AAC.8
MRKLQDTRVKALNPSRLIHGIYTGWMKVADAKGWRYRAHPGSSVFQNGTGMIMVWEITRT